MRARDVLEQIGRDCAGAFQLLPLDSEPPDVRSIEAEPEVVFSAGENLRHALTARCSAWQEI